MHAHDTAAGDSHPALPVRDAFTARAGSQIVDEAVSYLLAKLVEYSNEVGPDHETALRGLIDLADGLTSGALTGRIRFGLSCGMGKTTAVRSWLRALTVTGSSARVTVAASKVEQLCALKRQLIAEDGVPANRIGLMHSYEVNPKLVVMGREGYASEPSEGHDRQFLLVTHANMRPEDGRQKPWMIERASGLVFYDESLVVAQALTLPLIDTDANSLAAEAAALATTVIMGPENKPLAEWAQATVGQLLDAARNHAGAEVRIVDVPKLPEDIAAGFLRCRPMMHERCPLLSSLVQQARDGVQFRVITSQAGQRALVSYTVTVPDILSNVIVLDASDAVREIVHHDHRMVRAEDVSEVLKPFRDVPGGLGSIKRCARVKVHFAKEPSGRGSMTELFRDASGGYAVEKLVRLVKEHPTKDFLVFTFKDRKGVHFARTVQQQLERAGIDLRLRDDGTSRVSILTWGMETASNAYAHCDAVVLLGVIHQREDVLAGTYLGQVDNLRDRHVSRLVNRLRQAECVHSIYQAANRGSMRKVEVVDGVSQARPCDVYVIHNDPELQAKLSLVMPGAEWAPWRESGEELTATEAALLIAKTLDAKAAEGYTRVANKVIRKEACPVVPEKTWRLAREIALQGSPWSVIKQSFVLGWSEHTKAHASA